MSFLDGLAILGVSLAIAIGCVLVFVGSIYLLNKLFGSKDNPRKRTKK